MTKVDDIVGKAKPWLQEALQFSTVPWSTGIVELDTMKPMRIDETDSGYQRPLSDSRVDDLVERFDAGEARDIWVSERSDGTRWILDGQHTWATLRKMGFTHWPTRIFYNLSLAEEARRFAEYQSNTRRIPSVVQFNAEVISMDPTAVALDKILSEFYLRISSSKLRHRDGYLGVTSRAVFQRIYELGGTYTLREVLQVAVDAWGQNSSTFLGRVLQGMGYLFCYADTELDRGRFVAVLKNTTSKQLIEAIGPTGSGGASRAGAFLLLEKYLDGVPGYPRIRHNAKEAPHLPDIAPSDAYSKDPERNGNGIWTPETVNTSRTSIKPLEKVQKPTQPIEIDIELAMESESIEMGEIEAVDGQTVEEEMDFDEVVAIETPLQSSLDPESSAVSMDEDFAQA